MEGQRTDIDENTKEKLIALYESGVDGTGKKHAFQIASAAQDTGLSETIIKV